MKSVKVMDLYNMLNDQRHLAILDLRNENAFNASQIRGSISIKGDPQKIGQYLSSVAHVATKNEEKYKTPKVRRILFVNDDPATIQNQKELIQELILALQLQTYKQYFLDSTLTEFQEKYPFLVLSQHILANYELNTYAELSQEQKDVLFSYSQFPSEFIENHIYLGNVFNANSKKQLQALKIKSLLDFKFYEDEKQIDQWKKDEYQYVNIPIPYDTDQIADFEYIIEQMNSLQHPLLIYCPDGYNVVNCIAAAYLMKLKKVKYDIATLKIFQLRGNTVVHKYLYQQILTYDPQVKPQQYQQQQEI